MKTIAFTASILLLSATACLAQSSNIAGSTSGAADQQNNAAIRGNEPSNPQAMSSENTSGQTKGDAQTATPQSAQMPSSCTAADQTCANGRNPSVQSPTQKREQPASPN
ncbi:MAG TPA: hypothetical protein VGF92_16490 [Stellaceae bacterium]|jgi:hypothetical protein